MTVQAGARVSRLVNQAWTDVQAHMKRMHASVVVSPTNPREAFTVDDTSDSELVVVSTSKTIVMQVPEKASSPSSNLFVAISGWLKIDRAELDSGIRTHSFNTKVAYFRLKNGALDHVYGVRYDMDTTSPGHPVFHAQMRGMDSLRGDMPPSARVTGSDYVKPMLSNVRTPTAQMDVFSVILQVCSDHLMGEHSDDEVRKAYLQVHRDCGFLIGAAHSLALLHSVDAAHCYRSAHWYGHESAKSASQAAKSAV